MLHVLDLGYSISDGRCQRNRVKAVGCLVRQNRTPNSKYNHKFLIFIMHSMFWGNHLKNRQLLQIAKCLDVEFAVTMPVSNKLNLKLNVIMIIALALWWADCYKRQGLCVGIQSVSGSTKHRKTPKRGHSRNSSIVGYISEGKWIRLTHFMIFYTLVSTPGLLGNLW